MSLSIDLKKFNELYNIQLLPKEQILKELNITEYFYKKIIKEFNIKRKKRTCEFERIKNANKEYIEVIKLLEDDKNIKPKKISIEKINILKNIEQRQNEKKEKEEHEKQKKQQKPQEETTTDETKYNEAMKEAYNVLKTTKRTLKDKEIL